MTLKRFSLGLLSYASANFISRGSIFLMAPLFTRVMSPGEYGQWVLFLSAFGVINIIFDFGISRAIPRFYYDHYTDLERIKRFFGVSLAARLLVYLVAIVVYFLLAPFALGYLTNGGLNFWNVGIPLVLISVFESFNLFALSFFRAAEKPISYLLIRAIGTAFQLSGFFIFFYLDFSPLAAVTWGYSFGTLLASLVAIFLLVFQLRYPLRLFWNSDGASMVKYGFPLIFHDLGTWIRNAADPFILIHFLSLTAVSIYSLSVMSGLAVALLAFSIDLAYTPLFYKMLKADPIKGRMQAVSVAKVYSYFMGVVVLIPVLFSFQIYDLILPLEYIDAAIYSPVISIAYFLFVQYTIFIKPVFFHKKTKFIPLITMFPSILGVICNVMLVPVFGIVVPPYTWLLTFGLMAGLAYWYSSRIDSIRFNLQAPFMTFLVLILVAAFVKFLDGSNLQMVYVVLIKLGVFSIIAGGFLFATKVIYDMYQSDRGSA